MLFQTGVDPSFAENAFRTIVNALTNTLTLTAGSIALHSPVVLETASASRAANYVNRPATSTSVLNNLMVGIVAKVPGTKTYLDREEVGLAQCYGYYSRAIVHRATAGANAGSLLIPNSLQCLVAADGPITSPSTAAVQVPAIGGLAVLMEAVATSSATEQTTADVFLRCM